MMNIFTFCLLAVSSTAAVAQSGEPIEQSSEQVVIYQREELTAGTPLSMQLTQTITTEGGSWKEGNEFSLIVAEDVMKGNHVVIPSGTLAFGHVRWSTGRGMFGKSGKIEIQIDYLVLGGRKVKLTGAYREEGKGELTSAGTVVAAGLLTGLIMGESGEIPRGSLLTAYLAEDLGYVVPYRPKPGPTDGTGAPMVRARQISVAEAFRAPPQSSDGPVRGKRLTVAEAFKTEIEALDNEP
jgi:hypothetical protein